MYGVQDWFASNRQLMQELHRLVVKEKQLMVNTAGKVSKALIAANSLFKCIPASTLTGWFTFKGVKCARHVPVPTPTFTQGIDAGYNVIIYRATGRKPKIVRTESFEEPKDCMRGMRTASVSANIPALRALLVGILEKNKQQHIDPRRCLRRGNRRKGKPT